MARSLTNLTPDQKKELFLLQLCKEPNITKAAQRAGYTRQYVYELRDADEAFAKAWDQALEQSLDAAEGELYRRAVQGVLKPIYQGGVKVGTIREYSDTLLIFYLKTRGKKRGYVERQEISGPDGDAITVKQVDYRNGIDTA